MRQKQRELQGLSQPSANRAPAKPSRTQVFQSLLGTGASVSGPTPDLGPPLPTSRGSLLQCQHPARTNDAMPRSPRAQESSEASQRNVNRHRQPASASEARRHKDWVSQTQMRWDRACPAPHPRTPLFSLVIGAVCFHKYSHLLKKADEVPI